MLHLAIQSPSRWILCTTVAVADATVYPHCFVYLDYKKILLCISWSRSVQFCRLIFDSDPNVYISYRDESQQQQTLWAFDVACWCLANHWPGLTTSAVDNTATDLCFCPKVSTDMKRVLFLAYNPEIMRWFARAVSLVVQTTKQHFEISCAITILIDLREREHFN